MQRIACILVLLSALLSSALAEKPEPEAAPEPFPKPVFTQAGHTLSIKLGDDTYLIEGVHFSPNPSLRWKADELYHPTTHLLAVPMADESYHIYDLDKVRETGYEQRPVPECIIDGGVAGFRGNFWRSRQHWYFTGWASEDTLHLVGDTVADSDADSVMEAEVNIEVETFRPIRRCMGLALVKLSGDREHQSAIVEGPHLEVRAPGFYKELGWRLEAKDSTLTLTGSRELGNVWERKIGPNKPTLHKVKVELSASKKFACLQHRHDDPELDKSDADDLYLIDLAKHRTVKLDEAALKQQIAKRYGVVFRSWIHLNLGWWASSSTCWITWEGWTGDGKASTQSTGVVLLSTAEDWKLETTLMQALHGLTYEQKQKVDPYALWGEK